MKSEWHFPVFICLLILSLSNAQRRFPDHFQFGSASAAYQIEGAWNRDGKGENIWDYMTHNSPDRVDNGDNGDVACNSYDKYKEDVQLLKDAGMNFYRFSISWSRVLPKGDTSVINEAGLQYYDNLINELLANGIEPMVTMYHWDLPQAVQEIGGMVNPLIVDYFADYADVLFARYGDRVKTWSTFNEPIITCENGYGNTDRAPLVHAPGVGNYLCTHHVLLAHAKIYHLYQEKYKRPGVKVGIVINCGMTWPLNPDDPADVVAAFRRTQFFVIAFSFEKKYKYILYQTFYCGGYTHPIFSKEGGYPQIMIDVIGNNSLAEGRPWSRLPVMSEKQKEFIRGTSDFFGLNYYSSHYATPRTDDRTGPSFLNDQGVNTLQDPNWPQAISKWLRSVPEGLRELANWIKEEYDDPEIIVTENGWSDAGELIDVGRIEYLKGHLNAILDAIDDGVNITGHTTWSILDNFEWMRGYAERFGMVHVDFNDPDRKRTSKASVKVLREIIESRVVPN